MNWEAIGAIGEIAGALGVIFSLIYLATQIRNQNRESRLSAINSMTSQWNAFMSDMATHGDLADIWARGLSDFSCLAPGESVQLSTHFNRIFRIYESMYRQHQAGSLDEGLWGGITHSLEDFTKSPGVRTWWKMRKHWYASDFARYVQDYIEAEGEEVLTYGDQPMSQTENTST